MGVTCGIDNQICIYTVRYDAEYQIYILAAIVSQHKNQCLRRVLDDILVFPSPASYFL